MSVRMQKTPWKRDMKACENQQSHTTATRLKVFNKATTQQRDSIRWSVYSYASKGKTNVWKQTFAWPEKILESQLMFLCVIDEIVGQRLKTYPDTILSKDYISLSQLNAK